MNEYSELMKNVHEWKIKQDIKEEEDYFKEVNKEYRKEERSLWSLLLPIFLTVETKGIIKSEDLFKFNRIQKVEKEVAASLLKMNKIERARIKQKMKKKLEESIVQSSVLFNSFGINKNISFTNKQLEEILTVPWAGELYDETLKRRKQELAGSMKREIILKATGVGATIKDVEEVVHKNLEKSQRHSLLVLQNEISRLGNEGTKMVKEKMGIKTKVLWVAAYDDRTCSICSPLDGEEFEEGREPFIPVHPRCRCTTVPLFKDWEQGLRSARDLKTRETYLTNTRTYKDYREEQKIFKD